MSFNVEVIRKDFPILSQKINGRQLIYLDNGATSQKPNQVIDAVANYYKEINANVHRGVHTLSQLATDAFEAGRTKIQNHINAKESFEVILTSGTTHSINIVANGFSNMVKAGDEILISALEHHSNIVPWQMLCERSGATLKVIPMNLNGELIMEEFDILLNSNTKIVAVNHVSNALGTINPIRYIIAEAHKVGAAVLIDGAQAVAHIQPDMQELDCDFYTFSAHKICGPTGTGILYGKEEWLNKLIPFQGGGEMIKDVSFEKTTYADLPHRLEAGTPNIAGVIGFGAAIDYMQSVDMEAIAAHEEILLKYATEELLKIPELKIWGTANEKVSVISFNVGNLHPYDIGTILDNSGIAVRTGHHCAQPIMKFCDIPGTVRASFSFYNTKEEIDTLVSGILKAQRMLS